MHLPEKWHLCSLHYTKEQVFRIVEEAFRRMDETMAPQEPLNLDNDMPQNRLFCPPI